MWVTPFKSYIVKVADCRTRIPTRFRKKVYNCCQCRMFPDVWRGCVIRDTDSKWVGILLQFFFFFLKEISGKLVLIILKFPRLFIFVGWLGFDVLIVLFVWFSCLVWVVFIRCTCISTSTVYSLSLTGITLILMVMCHLACSAPIMG